MTRAPTTLGIVALLATTGCCDLAAYFCGPDKSPWVPISYQTHGEALATFMEAVRRDNVRVICESLSPRYKTDLGIPGCFEAALAWDMIKEQTPGAHMLGLAEVQGPEILAPEPPAAGPPTLVRYTLEVAGQSLFVDLAPHAFAGIRYRSGELEQPLDSFVPSLRPLVQIAGEPGGGSTVTLRVPDLALPDGVTAREIVGVIGGQEWKVVGLRQLE